MVLEDSSSSGQSSSKTVSTKSSVRFGIYIPDEDDLETPQLLADPCGNGTLDSGEQCDDGNTSPGDGCSAFCRLEQNLVAAASVCGDGQLSPSEECDDGNRRDNDGCSTACLLEIGICGDGIIQSLLGEQCEQASPLPTGVQCSRCRYLSLSCGDGNTDPGEECDDGTANSTAIDARCRPDCSLGRCGDAIKDSNEQCDDGNRKNGDGCDRNCNQEQDSTPTQVAADTAATDIPFTTQQPNPWPFNVNFPNQQNGQPVPYQLPLAQLQPLIQGQAPIGDTGPAAVVAIAAGAAGGFGYMRKKRRK